MKATQNEHPKPLSLKLRLFTPQVPALVLKVALFTTQAGSAMTSDDVFAEKICTRFGAISWIDHNNCLNCVVVIVSVACLGIVLVSCEIFASKNVFIHSS